MSETKLRIVHAGFHRRGATRDDGALATECGEKLHENDVKDAMSCLSRVTCRTCLDWLINVKESDIVLLEERLRELGAAPRVR
jgi:hypothetical protein